MSAAAHGPAPSLGRLLATPRRCQPKPTAHPHSAPQAPGHDHSSWSSTWAPFDPRRACALERTVPPVPPMGPALESRRGGSSWPVGAVNLAGTTAAYRTVPPRAHRTDRSMLSAPRRRLALSARLLPIVGEARARRQGDGRRDEAREPLGSLWAREQGRVRFAPCGDAATAGGAAAGGRSAAAGLRSAAAWARGARSRSCTGRPEPRGLCAHAAHHSAPHATLAACASVQARACGRSVAAEALQPRPQGWVAGPARWAGSAAPRRRSLRVASCTPLNSGVLHRGPGVFVG